ACGTVPASRSARPSRRAHAKRRVIAPVPRAGGTPGAVAFGPRTELPSMRVDLHCHLAPTAFLREFARLAKLGDPIAAGGAGMLRRAGEPAIWSEDPLLEELDRNQVDLAVLSMHPPSVFVHDRAGSVALAQIANDHYASLIRQYPGRFAAL